MRKVVSIILVGFIIIWTYNLFIDNIIVLEEVEEEPYKGMIRIWDVPRENMNISSMYPWFQDKIKTFERRNAGVYIEYISKDWHSIYDVINGNIEEGEMPDIISIDSNFYDFNVVEALDEYLDKDEIEGFKHQVLKAVTYNEQLAAIPVAMSTNVLYLNLDIFRERGVSPPVNGDWTYDEFVDSLERFNYDTDDDGIIDQYGFITDIGSNCYNIWGIILADGAELINPKRVEYNFYGEKAIKGLERVVALRDEYHVVPDYFGIIDEKDAWEMFYKDKKVATFITGAWAVDFLDKLNNSGEGFSFDIVNFPKGDKNLPIVLSDDIVSYGILKDEDTKKIKMCVNFLKYMTNDSNQRSLEDMGLFTVKRCIDDMYVDNLKMKKIEQSLEYTKYIPFMDRKIEIDAIIQEEIRNAILGKKPSHEAIENAKIEIDKLINKN